MSESKVSTYHEVNNRENQTKDSNDAGSYTSNDSSGAHTA